MKRFSKLLLLVVFTTLTIALGGCAGDKQGESSSQITIGIPQDLEDSLDPHEAVAAGTKEVLFNLFEGLYKPDSDGNLIPAVASDYTVSEDGLTYTFTLREGVKFHNGNAVTADDVKYSIEKFADISNKQPLVEAFSNISEVTIVDDSHVSITLATTDSDIVAQLAMVTAAIIPKDAADMTTNPVGTGPYKFVSRSPQENFVVEKFDEYWGEAAHIEDVTFKICANADTVVMDLMGGSIDMFARLPISQADQLSGDFQVLEGTMNLVQAMYLNNNVEPFNDVRVRQALCYAVDQQEIMQFVSNGKGSEIGSSMFPSFGKYFMEELNDVYNKDIDKAKELLADAGYPDGFTFTIQVPSNYTQHIDTAQVLVEQLKEINVTAEINLIEWDSWLSEVYAGRNFEATVVGVDASSLTARALLERFVSDMGNNFINFNNAEYDESFKAAMASTDEEERTACFKRCEEILTQDAANVYIQDIAELVVIRDGYAGYEFYPLYVQDVSKLYIVEE